MNWAVDCSSFELSGDKFVSFYAIKNILQFYSVYLIVKTCDIFLISLARAEVLLLFNSLLALLFSLFYVIREFDRLLHPAGMSRFIHSLLIFKATQAVIFPWQNWQSLLAFALGVWTVHVPLLPSGKDLWQITTKSMNNCFRTYFNCLLFDSLICSLSMPQVAKDTFPWQVDWQLSGFKPLWHKLQRTCWTAQCCKRFARSVESILRSATFLHNTFRRWKVGYGQCFAIRATLRDKRWLRQNIARCNGASWNNKRLGDFFL